MMTAKPVSITNNHPSTRDLGQDLPAYCNPHGKFRHWLGSAFLAASISVLAACGGGGGGGDEEPAASTTPPATAQTPSQPTATTPVPETPTQTPTTETPSTSQTESSTTPPSTSIVDTVIDTVTETVKEVVNTITETVKETVQTVVEAVTPTPPPSQTTTTTETTPTTTETNAGNNTSSEPTNPPATTEPEPTTPVYTASTAYDHIYDNRIGLGSDANGIPILHKHENSNYIYWNPTHPNANDANAGTDPNHPKATPASALSAIRDGKGDWLLMAQGATHPEGFGQFPIFTKKGGVNASYPSVITTYDPADPTNSNKMRKGMVTLGTNPTAHLLDIYRAWPRHFVIENIDFSKTTASKWGVGFTYQDTESVSLDFLFHNVIFRKISQGWMGGQGKVIDPQRVQNVIFRHCVFYEGYAPGSHGQGIYLWKTSGFTVEDSILYHNGWSDDGSRDTASEKPDIFKHNAYFGTMTYNTIFRRNISGHASSHGLQMRGGGIVNDNVFISNPINVMIGGGDNYNTYRPEGVPYQFNNNVIIGSSNITSALPRGFGIDILNTQAGGEANNNLIVNINKPEDSNQRALNFGLSSIFDTDTYFNLTNSIIYNWNMGRTTDVYSGKNELDGLIESYPYPSKLHFTYSDNIIHFDVTPTGSNLRLPPTNYQAPERSIASFALAYGYSSEDSLWQAMISNPKHPWASRISNYIRAGFSR